MQMKDKDVGYVYILSNPAMPDFVKIGHTMKKVEERAKELSNTAVPLPYTVEHEELVEKPMVVERLLHAKLRNFRVSRDREFFKVSAVYAEEELNLILYGERCPIASFPKKVVNLFSLTQKYPQYFNDKDISPENKFLIFKAMENSDPNFREAAQKEKPGYEAFMGKFEDRANPMTYLEASERFNKLGWD